MLVACQTGDQFEIQFSNLCLQLLTLRSIQLLVKPQYMVLAGGLKLSA